MRHQRRNDRAGDRAGMALLAKLENDVGEIAVAVVLLAVVLLPVPVTVGPDFKAPPFGDVEPGHDLDPAHHEILLSNCFAQGAALMAGKQSDDPARAYPGDRGWLVI